MPAGGPAGQEGSIMKASSMDKWLKRQGIEFEPRTVCNYEGTGIDKAAVFSRCQEYDYGKLIWARPRDEVNKILRYAKQYHHRYDWRVGIEWLMIYE